MPLYDLNINTQEIERISDLVDLSKFSPRYPNNEPSDISFWGFLNNTDVLFYLESDNVAASDWFTQECEAYVQHPSWVKYGGEGDNQYCLPYVTQARNDPEGLCLPIDQYHSYVVFQKGRMVIVVDKTSSKHNGEDLDDVILMIADSFR